MSKKQNYETIRENLMDEVIGKTKNKKAKKADKKKTKVVKIKIKKLKPEDFKGLYS